MSFKLNQIFYLTSENIVFLVRSFTSFHYLLFLPFSRAVCLISRTRNPLFFVSSFRKFSLFRCCYFHVSSLQCHQRGLHPRQVSTLLSSLQSACQDASVGKDVRPHQTFCFVRMDAFAYPPSLHFSWLPLILSFVTDIRDACEFFLFISLPLSWCNNTNKIFIFLIFPCRQIFLVDSLALESVVNLYYLLNLCLFCMLIIQKNS